MTSSPKSTPNTDPASEGSPMLEWTGERYLPWIKDAAIAYEHLHRYAFAARLAEGKQVLDLASGEGYGAHMLASRAQRVVGLDIDAVAIDHARRKYSEGNLEFVSGSVTNIPLLENHGFDMVVCFEAIEHVEEHQKLLSEVKRMLKPDGIFVVSTPNKRIYQHASVDDNPFHVRELEFDEFQSLLQQFFKNAHFLGQRTHANSSIWSISGSSNPNVSGVEESVIARDDSDDGSEFHFVANDKREPLYFIAVASDANIPDSVGNSVLIDSSDQLLKDKDSEIADLIEGKISNELALAWRETQLRERDQAGVWYEDQIREHGEHIRQLAADIHQLQEVIQWRGKQLGDAQATIASQETGIVWLKGVVEELEQARTALTEEVKDARRRLEEMEGSRGWRWIQRLRRLRSKFTGEGRK